MRNKRWNPALRHTLLGEPGNAAFVEAVTKLRAAAERYQRAHLYAAQVRVRKAMGDKYEHAKPWQGPAGVMKLKDGS
jgi:hypothetical protein